MSICRVCHVPFSTEYENPQSKHTLFWFACLSCVKKARTKTRFHKRRRKANGTISATDWLVILLMADFRCAHCNEKKPNLTLDHVHSLGEGGKNLVDNIQPLCLTCHTEKAKLESQVQLERQRNPSADTPKDYYCDKIPGPFNAIKFVGGERAGDRGSAFSFVHLKNGGTK